MTKKKLSEKAYKAMSIPAQAAVAKSNDLNSIAAQVDPHGDTRDYNDNQWADLGCCAYIFGVKLIACESTAA